MTQDEAEEFFGPFVDGLRRCLMQAEKAYQSNTSGFKHVLRHRREKAMLRNAFILDEARRTLLNDPRIRVIEENQTDFLLFENLKHQVVVKFKKLSKARLSSNVQTRAVRLFRGQKNLDLPGIPSEAEHFEIGYVLNSLGQVSDLSIVRPQRRGISYHIDIHTEDNVEQIDYMRRNRPAPEVETRAKVKPILKKEKKNNGRTGGSSQ